VILFRVYAGVEYHLKMYMVVIYLVYIIEAYIGYTVYTLVKPQSFL